MEIENVSSNKTGPKFSSNYTQFSIKYAQGFDRDNMRFHFVDFIF